MSDFDRLKQFGYQVGFDLIKEGKQYLEITTTGDRHTFPFACPAEVGVAHFATDLIARMIPEIERLRDQNATLLEATSKGGEMLIEQQNRIEDLEKENEQLREIEIIQEGAHIAVTIGGVDALPLCIHRNFGDDMELESHPYGGRHITTDQIRKAWAYARSLPAGSEVRISIFYALRLLNIVRCEGCGGLGSVALDDERILHGPFNSKGNCPDCNGEGFTHPSPKSQCFPSTVGTGALEEDDV